MSALSSIVNKIVEPFDKLNQIFSYPGTRGYYFAANSHHTVHDPWETVPKKIGFKMLLCPLEKDALVQRIDFNGFPDGSLQVRLSLKYPKDSSFGEMGKVESVFLSYLEKSGVSRSRWLVWNDQQDVKALCKVLRVNNYSFGKEMKLVKKALEEGTWKNAFPPSKETVEKAQQEHWVRQQQNDPWNFGKGW